MSNDDLYRYKARVVSVYDADTVTLDIDLGLNTWRLGESVRLFGVNAPEVRGEQRQAGLLSRDWLRHRLPPFTEVRIRTHRDKTGKYGRLLADIFLPGETESLNRQLVAAGMAEEKVY
jgi:micrococcal nuclease